MYFDVFFTVHRSAGNHGDDDNDGTDHGRPASTVQSFRGFFHCKNVSRFIQREYFCIWIWAHRTVHMDFNSDFVGAKNISAIRNRTRVQVMFVCIDAPQKHRTLFSSSFFDCIFGRQRFHFSQWNVTFGANMDLPLSISPHSEFRRRKYAMHVPESKPALCMHTKCQKHIRTAIGTISPNYFRFSFCEVKSWFVTQPIYSPSFKSQLFFFFQRFLFVIEIFENWFMKCCWDWHVKWIEIESNAICDYFCFSKFVLCDVIVDSINISKSKMNYHSNEINRNFKFLWDLIAVL